MADSIKPAQSSKSSSDDKTASGFAGTADSTKSAGFASSSDPLKSAETLPGDDTLSAGGKGGAQRRADGKVPPSVDAASGKTVDGVLDPSAAKTPYTTDDTSGAAHKPVEAGYKVAPGKSITSKRGILQEGELVKPADVGGDPARLDELVEAGALVKS